MVLFNSYSMLLKREFCTDFEKIMVDEDFGPMNIDTIEQYNEVVNTSWFKDPQPERE